MNAHRGLPLAAKELVSHGILDSATIPVASTGVLGLVGQLNCVELRVGRH
jgi:hypothetical protein